MIINIIIHMVLHSLLGHVQHYLYAVLFVLLMVYMYSIVCVCEILYFVKYFQLRAYAFIASLIIVSREKESYL